MVIGRVQNRVRYVLVCAMVLVSGCSAGPEDQTEAQGRASGEDLPARAAMAGMPIGLDALDGVTYDSVYDVRALVSSATEAGLAPSHVAALEDGQVSFAEYERLYADFKSCAADSGVQLHDMGLVLDTLAGVEIFEYGVPVDGDGNAPDGVIASCETQFLTAAQGLYFRMNQLPLADQEREERMRYERLYDCLVRHEVALNFERDDVIEHQGQLLSFLDTYPDCPPPW